MTVLKSGLHSHHCYRRFSRVSWSGGRSAILRPWRIGMCCMRRIFLSRPYCRSRRWRRHRLRRGILSEWPCKKVYLIVRKDYLRASKVMQKRVLTRRTSRFYSTPRHSVCLEKEFVEGAHLIEYAGTDRAKNSTSTSTDSSWQSDTNRIPIYSRPR